MLGNDINDLVGFSQCGRELQLVWEGEEQNGTNTLENVTSSRECYLNS